MESIFHSLKTEWIRGRSFATFASTTTTAYTPALTTTRLKSMRDWWRETVSAFSGEDPGPGRDNLVK